MMFNILAPTDFSDHSMVAVKYAARLAGKINARLVLLHAMHLPIAPGTHHAGIREGEERAARLRLSDVAQALNTGQSRPVQIDSDIMAGNPVESILEYLESHDFDLVVMGTKGVTGLAKVLMGSVCSGVVDSTACPVLTVPAGSEFHGINRIACPIEMNESRNELAPLLSFAKKLGAEIEFLHISPLVFKEADFDEKASLSLLKEKYGYEKITYKAVLSSEILEEINRFVGTENADVLAIYKHSKGFFDIFSKSLTGELVEESEIPFLIIKNS